jgi:hypothetical protein
MKMTEKEIESNGLIVIQHMIKLNKEHRANIIPIISFCMKLLMVYKRMTGEEKKKAVIQILQYVEDQISDVDIFSDSDIEMIIEDLYYLFNKDFKIKYNCCSK